MIDLENALGAEGLSGQAGAGVRPVLGVRGFDAGGVNYLQTAAGMAGSVNGFWSATWFVAEATGAPANRTMARTTSPASGWRSQTGGSNTNTSFGATDGGGVARTSPLQALTAADLGKLHLNLGVYDQPNALLRFYWARAEVGAGTAFASYTPASASNRVGDGTPNIGVLGWAGGHAIPTLAQVQAYFDLVKSTRRMLAMPGVQTDRAYTFDRVGTVTDAITGVGTYLVTGALTLGVYAPNWGW